MLILNLQNLSRSISAKEVSLTAIIEHFQGHSSLALDWVGPLVVELDSYFPAGNFFAALGDFAHSECYSMKNWGRFATLHCKCWGMDCSLEDSYSGPHSSLAPDL
jgi:hypothetical protein